VSERVYAVLGTHWNALYPDCFKLYKIWMNVFTQFRVRIGRHGTQVVRNIRVGWAWLYASGYPLKCIAPLFPIGTRNLHSSRRVYQNDRVWRKYVHGPWCDQPSDGGRLRNRTEPACHVSSWSVQPFSHSARMLHTEQTDRHDRQTTDRQHPDDY